MNTRSRWAAAFSALLVLAAGCSQTPVRAVSAGPVYPMRGMILGKSALTHQIVVQQGVIRNFSPAMNAVYTVSSPDIFGVLQPGDQIAGDVLSPTDGSDLRLRDLAVTAQPTHPMTPDMLPPHQLLMGEQVPDIPMVNQDGKPLHFPQLRGKAVLITFIDTRCTEDCPILTSRFEKVDALLQKNPKAFASARLVSISIDPANDKPPVLRRYGLQYLDHNPAGFAHWQFVDLTPADLKKLATAFGVIYRPSGDDIIHTMTTALIGPDNTVIEAWGGDDWDPAAVAKAVAAAAVSARPS